MHPSRVALFVHGYTDDSAVWQDLFSALSEKEVSDWQFNAIDLQAVQEETEDSERLLEAFADQVVEYALDVAGDRDLVLVGHSMGGAVVELAAGRLGKRVKGVILVTPAPLKGSPLPPDVMQRFESRLGTTDAEVIKAGRLAMSQSLTARGLTVLVNSSLMTGRRKGLQQLKAWTGGHRAGMAASPISAPVLVIATDDRFFTRSALAEATRRFARSSLAHIPAAGHWAHVEKPVELAYFVDEFLRSVSKPGFGFSPIRFE
ncbi:alpha/beta fold hydrolase [Variovorax arabinosiphilus]|uniref:alpha/beta fold hydrolase n=1 Tax=Variovorax arabinosiphilus TaxID=3053498 RepID=UPI0025755036|nr:MULTISPECIES: alpha/beta hydrolase [unclassified Variovorax]MDM0118378.1 alpha/beta hydrolase [Variovorax sp. J2L1-78]MDM0128803.1 alpha/beta hydrolase [Variovorax sp. J2L1-63]MDM0233411.1 alpha/beta hydrolase [Variovorax sp. J2R1-6]